MALNVEQLLARMKNPEDNLTERKLATFKPEELRRTIVAFANTVGESETGVLFVGVEDSGKLVGVSVLISV